MFQLNDKVVYPGHGVAVVEEVIERTVAQMQIKFFKLTFIFKEMMILVPVHNVSLIGIRKPSSVDVAKAALDELYKKPERKLEGIDFTPSGWNRRNKEYQIKIQGGNIVEIAKVYRELMHVGRQKELSFGERTLLQTVEELMAQELQVIKNLDKESVIQELRTPFKSVSLHDRNFVQEPAVSI
jgi:CarD family transcriptional regulator